MRDENIDIVNTIIFNDALIYIPYMYWNEDNFYGMESTEGTINLLEINFEDKEECYKLFREINIQVEVI